MHYIVTSFKCSSSTLMTRPCCILKRLPCFIMMFICNEYLQISRTSCAIQTLPVYQHYIARPQWHKVQAGKLTRGYRGVTCPGPSERRGPYLGFHSMVCIGMGGPFRWVCPSSGKSCQRPWVQVSKCSSRKLCCNKVTSIFYSEPTSEIANNQTHAVP